MPEAAEYPRRTKRATILRMEGPQTGIRELLSLYLALPASPAGCAPTRGRGMGLLPHISTPSRSVDAPAPEELSVRGSMMRSMMKDADIEALESARAQGGSKGRPGPKPFVRTRLMEALKESPGYTSELALRIGASDDQTLRVLRDLEVEGLVRSWGFAQADRGGRLIAVHAWRLTTASERRSGKEDPNATARASALLSRKLRGRLKKIERMNELSVGTAQRDCGDLPR